MSWYILYYNEKEHDAVINITQTRDKRLKCQHEMSLTKLMQIARESPPFHTKSIL